MQLANSYILCTNATESVYICIIQIDVCIRTSSVGNVYDFSVLTAIRGMPLGLQYYSAICIMVLSGG